MGILHDCDSCGAVIEAGGKWGQLIVSDPGAQVAGPMIELCGTCIDNVLKDPKVKKGIEKFGKDRAAAMKPVKSVDYTPANAVEDPNSTVTAEDLETLRTKDE